MRAQDVTLPAVLKSSRMSPSVVLNDRLPTNNFVAIVLSLLFRLESSAVTVPDVRVSDCHRLFEGRLTIHRLTAKHCQLGELLTGFDGIATKLFSGSWVSSKSGGRIQEDLRSHAPFFSPLAMSFPFARQA